MIVGGRVSRRRRPAEPSGGVPSSVAFFGDSFTDRTAIGASTPETHYPARTIDELGLADAAEENHGVGGARQHLNTNNILVQVYQNTAPPSSAPYAPVHDAAVIQASINNLNLNSFIADLTIITRSLARAIRRIRAGGCYEALNTSRFSYTGTWADITTTDANSGTGVKRCTANGSTWTLSVPADFPGGVLRVYGLKVPSFGGVHTITVDGGAHGSIDNRGATSTSGSEPWEYPITLSAGAHSIVGTVSSLNTLESINGADFEVTAKPAVVVLNTARSPNYPGGEHSITNTDVTNSNAAVSSMLGSEFLSDPHVALVDLDAILANDPANFNADNIHPDDVGTALMAPVIAAAILGAM